MSDVDIDGDFGFVTLVRGDINNQPFWAYVSIFPEKLEEFLALQEGESYHLPDYGDFLEYKVGESEPSDDIKAMMEEKHKISHKFEARMQEQAKELFSIKPK